MDHYLLVQSWRPLFKPIEREVQKVVVWVRIPNLLAELYNQKFLWRVGSKLGTMLKIDNLTSIHSRGRFATICVELDLRRELIPSFTTLGRDFLVEYEGLRLICFNCGKYGHEVQSCPSSVKPVEITSSEPGSMTRDQILRKG